MFLRTLCYHNSSDYAKKMTKTGRPIFSPSPTLFWASQNLPSLKK
jgi:hypothetical protein